MKKTTWYLILAGLLMLAVQKSKAQVYSGMSLGAKANFNVGYKANQMNFETGYQVPFKTATQARLYYLSTGYTLEYNDFVFTPFVGYGYISKKDFSKYDSHGTIKEVKYSQVIYSAEIGKQINNGRVYLDVKYYDKTFNPSIGIKYFFK